MKRRTWKAKGIVAALLLLSVMALSLPSANAGPGVCQSCALQCTNDAWNVQMDCIAGGGSYSYCGGRYSQYLNACNAVICNYGLGCELPTNY